MRLNGIKHFLEWTNVANCFDKIWNLQSLKALRIPFTAFISTDWNLVVICLQMFVCLSPMIHFNLVRIDQTFMTQSPVPGPESVLKKIYVKLMNFHWKRIKETALLCPSTRSSGDPIRSLEKTVFLWQPYHLLQFSGLQQDVSSSKPFLGNTWSLMTWRFLQK